MNNAITSQRREYKHDFNSYKYLKFRVINSELVRIHFRKSSIKNLNRFKIETLEKRKDNEPKKLVNVTTDINKSVRLVKHIYETEKLILDETLIKKDELNEIRIKLNEISEGKVKYKDVIEYFSVLKEGISKYNFYEKLAHEKAKKLVYLLENLNEKDSRFEFNSKIMPTFMLLYAIENRINVREDEINSIIAYNKIREDSLRYFRDEYIKKKLEVFSYLVKNNPYAFKHVYDRNFIIAYHVNKYLKKRMSDFDSEFYEKHSNEEIKKIPKDYVCSLMGLIYLTNPRNKRAQSYLLKAKNIEDEKKRMDKIKDTYSILISNNLAYMGENLLKTEEHVFYKNLGQSLVLLDKAIDRKDFDYFNLLIQNEIKKLDRI